MWAYAARQGTPGNIILASSTYCSSLTSSAKGRHSLLAELWSYNETCHPVAVACLMPCVFAHALLQPKSLLVPFYFPLFLASTCLRKLSDFSPTFLCWYFSVHPCILSSYYFSLQYHQNCFQFLSNCLISGLLSNHPFDLTIGKFT